MRLNIDQQTDYSYRELHNAVKGINLPDFVKQANVDAPEDFTSLNDSQFADEANRLFPIDSAPRVFISNAFLHTKKAALVEHWGDNYVNGVEDRIRKAASAFNIVDDLDSFNKQADEKAAVDYKKDIVHTIKIGSDEVDMYPIKTAAEFDAAVDNFASNFRKFDFETRRSIASSFVEKAASFGRDSLPDIICKYAGKCFLAVPSEAIETIEYRSTKFASEELQNEYREKFVEQAKNLRGYGDVFKLASDMNAYEMASGLVFNPKIYLQDPLDALMSVDLDKVASALDVVEIGGKSYAISDLQKVPSEVYKQAFDMDIDPGAKEYLREVMPTMPLSDMTLFNELSGVSPLD